MADSFNNFFGKVSRRLAQNIDQQTKTFQFFLNKTKKIASTIALIPPTVNEVFNELNSLKSKKAAGSDDLAPFFIKTTSLVIAPYMTYFTEFMFNQGFVPNILKIAKVIPIYKSGDKSQRWSRGHKARGQGQGHKKKSEAKDSLSEDRHSRGQGQKCSRPRPRTKDTSASVFQKKRSSQKFFRRSPQKKFSKKFFKRSTKF